MNNVSNRVNVNWQIMPWVERGCVIVKCRENVKRGYCFRWSNEMTKRTIVNLMSIVTFRQLYTTGLSQVMTSTGYKSRTPLNENC